MPIPFTGKCDFVYDSEGVCRDLLLPATEEEANEVVSLEWPPGFRFGAATSAYQVEGGIVDTNWNRWEDMRVREGDGKETVRPNADGSVGAGKATDMWNLFESVDLPIIKQLGLSTFRFSVEWSRVQPKRDVFDQAAVDRYARWVRVRVRVRVRVGVRVRVRVRDRVRDRVRVRVGVGVRVRVRIR